MVAAITCFNWIDSEQKANKLMTSNIKAAYRNIFGETIKLRPKSLRSWPTISTYRAPQLFIITHFFLQTMLPMQIFAEKPQ
jgi:hypothetical protein